MNHALAQPATRPRDSSLPFASLNRVAPPRHRMRGGDVPRGSVPQGLGHAGRRHLGLAQALTSLALVLSVIAGLIPGLAPRTALAAETLVFANGGTATKRDDGTIVGKCDMFAIWVGQGTTFTFTMPDGQVLNAFCQTPGAVVPANGKYDFSATPKQGGGYSVYVMSRYADNYQDSDGTLQPGYTFDSRTWIQDVAIADTDAWFPNLAPQEEQPQTQPEEKPQKGRLAIIKESSRPELTDGNVIYSLKGAHYGIYTDAACTNKLDTEFIINTTRGTSSIVELDPGYYWIKETQAPSTYKLSSRSYVVAVEENKVSVATVQDTPHYGTSDVWVKKTDADDPLAEHTSTAALQNAVVSIRYYNSVVYLRDLPKTPTRTWLFKTDDKGEVVPDAEHLLPGSDELYMVNNKAVIPYGTIFVQETQAPRGYLLEGHTAQTDPTEEAPLHRLPVAADTFEPVTIANTAIRGDAQVHKVDASTGESHGQGDATLAGAEFTITLASEEPAYYGTKLIHQGEEVTTIETDENGIAATAERELPMGSYRIEETVPPEGYLTNEGFVQEFEIDQDEKHVELTCEDEIIRGGISVQKVSRETGLAQAQGAATLEDAEFEVTLASTQPVWVDGQACSTGDIVCVLTTNAEGYATTNELALPYGTYVVTESKAPKGYLLNDAWKHEFSIRNDGEMVAFNEGDADDEQVIRGDFHFVKVSESTGKRMAGIPFMVTSTTTQEHHLLVSDENGTVSTRAASHEHMTNANDDAYFADGTLNEEKLDAHHGVWFMGSEEVAPTPRNELGALPFDTYTVDELPCSANDDYELVSFEVTIYAHDSDVDMGTVTNHAKPQVVPPSITTTLVFDNDQKTAPAEDHLVLVDHVSCENLVPGTDYELEARLVNKDGYHDGDAPLSTGIQRFTADDMSQTINVELDEIGGTELAGTSIVCFETLYEVVADGNEEFKRNEVARHEDLHDNAQTLRIASIPEVHEDVPVKETTSGTPIAPEPTTPSPAVPAKEEIAQPKSTPEQPSEDEGGKENKIDTKDAKKAKSGQEEKETPHTGDTALTPRTFLEAGILLVLVALAARLVR